MGTLIPTIGSARFDTRGELRLAERLQALLEDNAYIWHNLPQGPRGRHPDFVLLHPARGVLVLEVKDWHLDTMLRADKNEVELHTERGPVRVESPFEQARTYMFDVVRTIERDPQLVFGRTHSYKGRSIAPFGFGVVFTNITRRQFEQTNLREVFQESRCLFRDEMSESVEAERFRAQLWAMVSPRLGAELSLPQFDRIRALLFPEIRIRQIALPFDAPAEEATAPQARDDRVLAVMDLQQEQLARSLGGGHRILRGVAGSGKTLILAFRAEYLAQACTKPILLLSFANGIAGRLENAMQDRGVEDRVQVATFHSWCWRMLKTYDIAVPNEPGMEQAERLAANVKALVAAVDRGQVPAGQYDAVLIDEAHDFEPDWLALAARMVNPDTRALLLAYDDMQAIYKGRARPVWRQLGIDARGRTTVLKVNYRNTSQILRFARGFADDLLGAPGLQAGDEDAVLLPEDAGRDGLEPVLRKCVSEKGEAHAIAEWLQQRHDSGYLWAHMAVLVPIHAIGRRIEPLLRQAQIPVDVAKDNHNRVDAARDAVRLLSLHNAKGLEFPCVAIAGLGVMGRSSWPLEDDVRLVYVGITRATHEVFLTYSRASPMVERLIG